MIHSTTLVWACCKELWVVLTASQNLKLLDSVDVEDRRRHGKIQSTMISDNWKLSRADPANRMEWRKKLGTNIGAVRPTLSGTDMLNE